MPEMVGLSIDKEFIEKIIRDEVRKCFEQQQAEEGGTFPPSNRPLTRDEFMEYANMSWMTIKKLIWYEPGFIDLRSKQGGRWRVSVEGLRWFDEWVKNNNK